MPVFVITMEVALLAAFVAMLFSVTVMAQTLGLFPADDLLSYQDYLLPLGGAQQESVS